jgi:hypothetical protein
MTADTQKARAIVQQDQSAPPTDHLAEKMPHLREHGLDLHGFHLTPLVLDIKPLKMTVKRPLFDFKGLAWGSRDKGDYAFFPCKMTFEGMPLFGFVYLDRARGAEPSTVRVVGPALRAIKTGMELTLEVDPIRAEFA